MRWVYMVENLREEELEKRLNKHGKEGWGTYIGLFLLRDSSIHRIKSNNCFKKKKGGIT